MTDLVDIAEFSSAAFAPVLPDECQVNPEVYGAELAFWLCQALAKIGVATSYPQSEDWGWYIEYQNEEGSEFAIHCGNVDGSNSRWLLSLRRFGRKMFGRDKPPLSDAARLILAVESCLEAESSVTDLDWLYAEPNATESPREPDEPVRPGR
jgi:hypothetical protein